MNRSRKSSGFLSTEYGGGGLTNEQRKNPSVGTASMRAMRESVCMWPVVSVMGNTQVITRRQRSADLEEY